MYENMLKLSLITISEEWPDSEKERYYLSSREIAINYLQRSTNMPFSDSLLLWSVYLFLTEFNFTGFDVLRGKRTGNNLKWLERRRLEIEALIAEYKKYYDEKNNI